MDDYCFLPSSVQTLIIPGDYVEGLDSGWSAWFRLTAELCYSVCVFCQAQLSAGMANGGVVLIGIRFKRLTLFLSIRIVSDKG